MPYCPSCSAEYNEGTKVCAECGGSLVARVTKITIDDDTADVFVCWDDQQVDRVTELLGGEGIDCLVRERGSSAFPMNVGTEARKIVAVPASELPQAQKLIETAVADGVLPKEGVPG